MPRFPAILAVLVATTLAGCTCPAWSTRPSVVYTPEVASPSSVESVPPPAVSELQQTQQVMDELKRLGAVDPAARDRLIEDLRQSDPAIWPLVVQQHRSTAAYRQQVEQKAATAQAQRLPPTTELAAVPIERPNPLPERQPEPATPVLPSPPVAVVPASYVATAAVETSQASKAALEPMSEPTSKTPERLEVRNVAFCTEVQSYGCIKPFKTVEFRPNQEVLLYAELEHFVSEPTPKGYCTSLCSRYEVLDARGRRVVEQKFSPTEEYCRNCRRDFFIGYRVRWPKDLAPGRYQLRLVIDDQKSHRSGEAVVQFDIQGDGGVKSAVAGG
ncbi:MAG: hypothetical protein LLF97_05090 [Planctomycetaceae bacterium]|nr:hypothetical protein [Planctomycetaceae bacterium]